jgi:hypothetical protein
MSPSAPIPPEKRGVAVVLFTIFGFLAGALGMFGGLVVLHAPVLHNKGASSGAAISAEDILREHLPPWASHCPVGNRGGDPIAGSAYASVICDYGARGIPSKVEYALFHDTIAANGQIDAIVKSLKLNVDSTTADCSRKQQVPGGADWYGSRNEKVQHILGQGDPEQMATSGGRMICYVDTSGLYWIDWVDNDTHIYAFASVAQENYPKLFDWWKNDAGPFHTHPLSGHDEMATTTPNM